MRVFRDRLSICVLGSFSFGFEGGVLDLIVLVPKHCLYYIGRLRKSGGQNNYIISLLLNKFS